MAISIEGARVVLRKPGLLRLVASYAYRTPGLGYATTIAVAILRFPRIITRLHAIEHGATAERLRLEALGAEMAEVRGVLAGLSHVPAMAEAFPALVEAVTSTHTSIRMLQKRQSGQPCDTPLPPSGAEPWRAWIDPQIDLVPERTLRRQAPTSLNRTPFLSDWRVEGPLTPWMKQLRQPHVVHRKMWEYAICLEGLSRLGAVSPQAHGLAVGAGSEPPLFYYANTIERITAIDLYDNPDHEGTPAMLADPASFAPFPYREDHLQVLQMSGDDLRFEDGAFDFAFCISSIEHFGSREAQTRAFAEMARVVKTGGVVCVITELILNGERHPEYFTPSEIWQTFLQNPDLSLEGELDLRVSDALPALAVDIRVPEDLPVTPHLLLTDGRVLWTSLSMFFRKR